MTYLHAFKVNAYTDVEEEEDVQRCSSVCAHTPPCKEEE